MTILRSTSARAMLGLALCGFLAPRAEAQPLETTLYATDGKTLYAMDSTGGLQRIGDFGVPDGLYSMTYDQKTDTLYALGGYAGSDLYTINRRTGEAIFVARTTLYYFSRIACDPRTGIMYAVRQPVLGGNPLEGLYRVNPKTGETTYLHSFRAGDFPFSMAFDSFGFLWVATPTRDPNRLRAIEPETGKGIADVEIEELYVSIAFQPETNTLFVIRGQRGDWQGRFGTVDQYTGKETSLIAILTASDLSKDTIGHVGE